ncbi:hypothetical protein BKA70DRAFT_1230866 [Coprinopsis sp. MPI-PUGE-AT-0042]|nr:hypothetical protein BKA70DRAFT_1230866 [Coprinopsis sp. MPI-PUGE-AT-0042]
MSFIQTPLHRSGPLRRGSKENVGPNEGVLPAKLPFTSSTRALLTPTERKIHKLQEKLRQVESKLRRTERQGAVNSGRLVDLASENRETRQELQDVLDKFEEASKRAQVLQQERDQYHAWWINEVRFSQSLMDDHHRSCHSFDNVCLAEVPISRTDAVEEMDLW